MEACVPSPFRCVHAPWVMTLMHNFTHVLIRHGPGPCRCTCFYNQRRHVIRLP